MIAGSLLLASVAALAPAPESGNRTLFGSPVRAAEALDDDEVARRKAAFDAMLEERGWVRHGDEVRPGDGAGGFAQLPAPTQHAWSTEPHRSTIFLNFFGAELTAGTNAALDESPCVDGAMAWPGFSGSEQQALALIEVFERQMEPYGVRIAYEERPPAHLPYAMVMMGGTPQMLGLPSSVLGVSCSSDCGDFWWRDTTFAFTDNINPNNASILGTTALHEAAHAFGLAHIGDPTKIMNPFVGSADVTWADTCTPYDDSTGGINCQSTHDDFCEPGAQNSHAELLAYFGTNSIDVEPPSVEILSPAGDVELAVGDGIEIEAEITDDHEGYGWKLVIPEVGQEQVAFGRETTWALNNLPEGTYTVRVEAIDHDRNVGFDEVKLYVGVPAPVMTDPEIPEDPGADPTGGSTADTGDGEDDSGGHDDATGDPGEMTGMDPSAQSCGCRTEGSGPPATALLLLGLVGLTRRRRAD